MTSSRKPIVWLHGEIKTLPFAREARVQAGYLLSRLQHGHVLSLPDSRPMPVIGARCHELRVTDAEHNSRIVYRVDHDAVLILEVFPKTTQKTPQRVLENCRRRLKQYDAAAGDER